MIVKIQMIWILISQLIGLSTHSGQKIGQLKRNSGKLIMTIGVLKSKTSKNNGVHIGLVHYRTIIIMKHLVKANRKRMNQTQLN